MSTPVPLGVIDDGSLGYAAGAYGELVDALLEYVPDLIWPLSTRTYARMRWDPQLRAVLSAYTLPVRRTSWHLDPAGCRADVVQRASDQFDLPVLGQEAAPGPARRRGFTWGRHLRLGLLKLVYGHMPFERVYDSSSGQRYDLAEVAERMPATIAGIYLDQATGQIAKISQTPLTAGAGRNVEIAAKNLVWYTHDREGSAWAGQSLLRSAYTPWLIKHELWRVHATSIRRFGMGIPEVQAPPGATPAQIAEAQRLASGVRAGDRAGVGLPAGFTLALKGMVGSAPDALGFIGYLDKQLTRATLTSLLDLSDTTHGSRALGETFLDLFLLALQAIANDFADQATDQLIVPWVDANYGDTTAAPRIVCGDVGSEHEVTAQTLQLLLASGAIEPDETLDAYVREQYKLPKRTAPWQPPASKQPVPDPTSTVPASADSVAVAAADRVYHWKHGWIPLDHAAALSKAKGDKKRADALISEGEAVRGLPDGVAVTEKSSAQGPRIEVRSPYNEAFVAGVRGLKGTWSPQTKTWTVSGQHAEALNALIERAYGSPGSGTAASVSETALPSDVSVIDGPGDTILVKAPYSETFRASAKSGGGRWDAKSKAWVFPAHQRTSVMQSVRAAYGTSLENSVRHMTTPPKPTGSTATGTVRKGGPSEKQIAYAEKLVARMSSSDWHDIDWYGAPPSTADLRKMSSRDISALISDIRDAFGGSGSYSRTPRRDPWSKRWY